MTMNELHALYERYFPSTPTLLAVGQGGRYAAGAVTGVTTAPDDGLWWMRKACCACGCGRTVYGKRMYFENACRQRVYRRRKKAGK
jgi:hypothetical protein